MEVNRHLDLKEGMIAEFKFRLQPSLLAIFRQRCQDNPDGPLGEAAQLRTLMVRWIRETSQGRA